MSRPTISIVLPVYNEVDAIRPVYEGVRDVLVEAGYDWDELEGLRERGAW